MRQSTCLRSYQDKFGSWSPLNERFIFHYFMVDRDVNIGISAEMIYRNFQ